MSGSCCSTSNLPRSFSVGTTSPVGVTVVGVLSEESPSSPLQETRARDRSITIASIREKILFFILCLLKKMFFDLANSLSNLNANINITYLYGKFKKMGGILLIFTKIK